MPRDFFIYKKMEGKEAKMRRRKVAKKRHREEAKKHGFMVSRHPMERLYSAFRDKILRKGIIVQNINGKGHKPTFNSFLTFLAMSNPTSYNR